MNGRKFLWLTENYPPQRGGMAQSCDRLIAGFQKEGALVDIFHFTNSQKRNTGKRIRNGHYVPLQIYDSEAHTINLAWNRISLYEGYDYLVCFGSHLSAIAAPVFAKWMDIPLVTLIRGNDFDHALFTPRKRAILDNLITSSSMIFTVSADKANKINKLFPNTSAVFIANGIDPESWQPSLSEIKFSEKWRHQNITKGRRCIGLIGDLKDKKGALFLFESISKTNISDQFLFLLIGHVEPKLSEFLNERQITHVCIPFQDRYELLKYYLCLDALAIPSFYDGMPNVMLEAGALGIPMIAANVDGMKDLLEAGRDSALFHPGDEDECRKAFYEIAQLPDDSLKKMGQYLKNKILNKYTLQDEIDSYKKHLTKSRRFTGNRVMRRQQTD
ncbi:MAG: glycosyltransferase family 4 protein [Cyclobacteriaceae bacterium]